MFPWKTLFAFERGSITFLDCNVCKQMQVRSVYICTLLDRVFSLFFLLTSFALCAKEAQENFHLSIKMQRNMYSLYDRAKIQSHCIAKFLKEIVSHYLLCPFLFSCYISFSINTFSRYVSIRSKIDNVNLKLSFLFFGT